MIAFRALAFLCFILLLAGMGAWEVHYLLTTLATDGRPMAYGFVLGLAPVLLLTAFLIDRLLKGNARLAGFAVIGALALPLVGLFGGVLQGVMGQKSGVKVWSVGLVIGALVGLNIEGTLLLGQIFFGGTQGLALAATCMAVQFFIVADYFLCRAVLHYFASGASAFVSLRYLRRRVISLLSVIGIMVGVFVLILINSVMAGFQTDFREQVRGSLSHLLVKFDSERLMLSGSMQDQLEWAEYVKRIEAEPNLLRQWNELLNQALERFRNDPKRPSDLDKNADSLPLWPEGQPPSLPEPGTGPEDAPRPANAIETELVKRLREGSRLTATIRGYLRQGGNDVTPREFYLNAMAPADEKQREALDAKIRESWFAPAFRRILQHEFNSAEFLLRDHINPGGERDVAGVSWRAATKTVITPRQSTPDLPIAELVGVDVEHETRISQLGDYVAAAEAETFRRRYVLFPLQQMLGACLGFEAASTGQKAGVYAFNYPIEAQDAVMPRDMTRQLKLRRLLATTEKVMWSDFDAIRYWPFTPGQALYERTRAAYKAASRTDDLGAMQRIVDDALRDLRLILQVELDKPPPANEGETRSRTGCRIILQEFLTGAGQSMSKLRSLVGRYHDEVALFSKEPQLAGEQGKWLGAVALKLQEATERQRAKIADINTGELEREGAMRQVILDYRTILQDAMQEGADKGYEASELLRDRLERPPEVEVELPFSDRAWRPINLPLAYAAAVFDARKAEVAARQDAYRKVLPLRTSMFAGDSPADYLKRAAEEGRRPRNDEPGVILGDALAESALGGVQIGDSIAVTIPRIYRDKEGRLTPRATEVRFTVTAFFHSGMYDDNFGRIYCDFDELARILSDSDTRYTLGVKFNDYSPYEGEMASRALKDQVGRTLSRGGVKFSSISVWEDEKRSLLEAVNRERTILGLIVAFILLLAGVLIIIVVYQLVSEKVKDIGILKALGHSPWGIRSVFMFNALFIGLFGAVMGGLLGIAASEYLNQIEDLVDQMTGIRLFPPEIYFLTYIPSLKGKDLLWLALDITVPAILWSFGCGILPAMAAARKDAIEALHNE